MKKLLTLFLTIFLIGNVSALTSGEGTILFGAIFSMLMCAVFFLIISIISKNIPLKVFFLGLSLLTIVMTVGTGVSVSQEFFTDFSALLVGYGGFYRLLLILIGAGAIALILWLLVVAFKSFYSYRGISDETEGLE